MEDYISKPVQVGELVIALSKCRPRSAMETALRRSEGEGAAEGIIEGSSGKGPSAEAVVMAVPLQELDSGAMKRLRATLGKQADRMLPGLIERFYQDVDRLLGEAWQALEPGQSDDLRRAAHSLKSTSATFGAAALSGVARELEYLARDGVLEGAAGLVAQAEAEFVKAKAALETMQKEL
jgi:HPt (histidine-containing phosphotransfer) domain-containing protein